MGEEAVVAELRLSLGRAFFNDTYLYLVCMAALSPFLYVDCFEMREHETSAPLCIL